jgi:hypothetical protein
MANNSSMATSMESLLSGYYFKIKESASNYLGADANGDDLFLVLVRAASTNPEVDSAQQADSLEPKPASLKEKGNAPAVSTSGAADAAGDKVVPDRAGDKAAPFAWQLTDLLFQSELMGGCDKQHCGGPVNNSVGQAQAPGPHQRRVPHHKANGSRPANTAFTGKVRGPGVQEQLDLFTRVAQLLQAKMQEVVTPKDQESSTNVAPGQGKENR